MVGGLFAGFATTIHYFANYTHPPKVIQEWRALHGIDEYTYLKQLPSDIPHELETDRDHYPALALRALAPDTHTRGCD